MAKEYDVAVIGAGAAGMLCAATAAQNGKRVVLIDHATKLAEKIRISGGGRCNFTNVNTTPANFVSRNPHFAKSALSRYTPQDFLALLKKHRVGFHEKHRGQLFCDTSAEQIIDVLKAECASGGVTWRMPTKVESFEQMDDGFLIATDTGDILAQSVVIATGGLSIPKIGATDFAYRIAEQFELAVIEPRPGLVPLTFDGPAWEAFAPLSGIALEVEVETSSGKGKTLLKGKFREDLLFTHRGLSGPAILQISSYWVPGAPIIVNLLPDVDVAAELIENKGTLKKQMGNLLSQWLPARLAERLLEVAAIPLDARLADMPDAKLKALGEAINRWSLVPTGSEGYRKAEVTLGGIDTRELSQQTMESSKVPGLYFIGEAVDVTGWLGGYNFQWAWASAVACGTALSEN